MAARSKAFRYISPMQLGWVVGGGLLVAVLGAAKIPTVLLAVIALAWAIVTLIIVAALFSKTRNSRSRE